VQLTGSIEIAAARQAVWDLVMDLESVAACAPGFESIERDDPTHASVRLNVGLGSIRVGLKVDLEIVEAVPLERGTLRGGGDAPGNRVEGTARIELHGPAEGPTTLAWVADVEVVGPLSGIGSRMIEVTAARLVDATVECVRARLTA
jgi:carbon monoxide dehydrogenase subunit G